jgi:predicted amidohydrolase YtcJ
MADKIDLLIQNGTVYTPNGLETADIAVRDGRVAAIG